MTLQGLRERVWRMLGVSLDSGTGVLFPTFWTAAEANRAINDAYREIARTTAALEMRQIVVLASGTHTYSLASTSGPVLRVSRDGYPMDAFDPTEMDRTDNYWRALTGQVTMYHVARLSPQKIRVYKIPTASGDSFPMSGEFGVITGVSGGTLSAELGTEADLTVDGTGAVFSSELGVITSITSTSGNLEVWTKRIPPLLATDADSPELPAYAHLGIAYSTAARLLSIRGEGAHAGKAQAYQTLAGESVEFLASIVRQRTAEMAGIVGAHQRKRVGAGRTPWTGQDDYAPIPYT